MMTKVGAISALIVDDDEDLRLLIRMNFEAHGGGLRVAGEAADGMAALEAVDELDPAVVILDQMMPFMNGLETAIQILDRRPRQRIILVSGFMDDWLLERALEAGVTACLDKRDLQHLPQLVMELVGGPNGGGAAGA